MPASSRSGTPAQRGFRSKRWKVDRLDARRPEAHVPVPGQCLHHAPRVAAEDGTQVAEPRRCRDRGDELLEGQGPVGERLADHLAEGGPVGRRQAVVALPAGELPLATGHAQGEVDAAVLGRHQVGGAAEREGRDQPAVGERLGDLARLGPLAPCANRQLGCGIELGRDGAQPAHDALDGFRPDRVEQLAAQAPGKRLRPVDRGHRARRAPGGRPRRGR